MNTLPFGLEEEEGCAAATIIHAGKTLLLGSDGVTSLWSSSISLGCAQSPYMKQNVPQLYSVGSTELV